MYVCLCNGFTERDVKRAVIETGAASVSKVHESVGSEPQCGKCSHCIKDIIKDSHQSR